MPPRFFTEIQKYRNLVRCPLDFEKNFGRMPKNDKKISEKWYIFSEFVKIFACGGLYIDYFSINKRYFAKIELPLEVEKVEISIFKKLFSTFCKTPGGKEVEISTFVSLQVEKVEIFPPLFHFLQCWKQCFFCRRKGWKFSSMNSYIFTVTDKFPSTHFQCI